MSSQRSPKSLYIEPNDMQQSEDEKYIQEFELNDFQQRNKVYELQSAIHNLSIQKEKHTLMYKQMIEQQRNKLQKANLMIEQLNQQNKQLKNLLHQVTNEKQQLKRQNENIIKKHQPQNSSHAQMIKQLGNRNEMIRQQSRQIQWLKEQKSGSLKSDSLVHLAKFKEQQNKTVDRLRKQLEQTLNKLQKFKRNEAQLKRQYDSMLNSKQEIIKKLTLQNEDHAKNLLFSKQKMNSDLKRQIQQLFDIINDNKQQLRLLQNKNFSLEKQVGKLKRQSRKKDSNFIYECQTEKEQIMRQYNQRIKNYLKEKEDKIQIMQQEKDRLETEVTNLRAEELKHRTQISSINQLVQYLEKVNKEHDSIKKKLQQTINQNDKQIGAIKQQAFKQANELKKIISNLKKQAEQEIKQHEEEIKEKNTYIQRMEKKVKTIDYHDSRVMTSFNIQIHKSIDTLKFENVELKENINKWTKKYHEKCEQAQSTELQLKKKYQDRLATLEIQIKQQKIKNMQIKALESSYDQQIRQEIDKIRLSKQLIELEKQNKIQQIKRLKIKIQQLQAQIMGLQQSNKKLIKDCYEQQQTNKYLKQQYENFQNQSRTTIKNLQTQLTEVKYMYKNESQKKQRKKTQSKDNEEKMMTEIVKLRAINQQLKQQLEQAKQINKITQIDIEENLIQLGKQLNILRQKQQKSKDIQTSFKKQYKKQEKQIQKLNDIIRDLQEKCQIQQETNRIKVDQFSLNAVNSQTQQLQNQNLKLRIEYSETLNELNILLQKHKVLEDTYKQCSEREDFIRQKFQKLQEKYKQLTIQKNQQTAELDIAYDQLNKQNISRKNSTQKPTQKKNNIQTNRQSPNVPQFSTFKDESFKSPSSKASNATERQKYSLDTFKKPQRQKSTKGIK